MTDKVSDNFVEICAKTLAEYLQVAPPDLEHLKGIVENDDGLVHEYNVFYKDMTEADDHFLDTATREYLYDALAKKFVGADVYWPMNMDGQEAANSFFMSLFKGMKENDWVNLEASDG